MSSIQIDPLLKSDFAIIGGGPRGTHVLQQLLAQNDFEGDKVCRIYDTARELGAGNVYALGQPAFLIMNNDCTHYSFFSDDFSRRYPSCSYSFEQFCSKSNETFSAFPARSLMGRYLHACFNTLVSLAKDNGLRVEHHQYLVRTLQAPNGIWSLSFANDAASTHLAQQVFVCTGHAPATTNQDSVPLGIYNSTWPSLPLEAKARSDLKKMLVIGSSLTAVDALLAMDSAMREAKWEDNDRHKKPTEDDENASRFGIGLYAQSQKFILPKTDLTKIEESVLSRIWEREKHNFECAYGPIQCWRAGVFHSLLDAAVREVCEHYGLAGASTKSFLAMWNDLKFYETLELGRYIITYPLGTHHKATVATVLGSLFRKLIPLLQHRFNHGNSTSKDRQWLADICGKLEKIAFGPPAVNFAKILKLYDAGHFQLLEDRPHSDPAVCINAFLPSYRDCARSGLVGYLASKGLVSTDELTGAVVCDAYGQVDASQNDEAQDLYVMSRASEYWALNHDSLFTIRGQKVSSSSKSNASYSREGITHKISA